MSPMWPAQALGDPNWYLLNNEQVATGSIWLSCSVGQNKPVINEQSDYLGPREQWNQEKPGNAITGNWLMTVNPGDFKKAVTL